uniref:Uncharacterized protein n=1 Tax=Anguilla anguilla TaxID=7936 RepID=A0A0E9WCQ8_ANGAN
MFSAVVASYTYKCECILSLWMSRHESECSHKNIMNVFERIYKTVTI